MKNRGLRICLRPASRALKIAASKQIPNPKNYHRKDMLCAIHALFNANNIKEEHDLKV
jgi:hypothetical protein